MIESKYLTAIKLSGIKLGLLSGSTPVFPDKFRGLISIGPDIRESRHDQSMGALLALFQSGYGLDSNCLHFTLGGSMAFFETLLFLKGKVDTIIFEVPYYEPYIAAARQLGFQVSIVNAVFEVVTSLDPEKTAVCLTSPNFFNGKFVPTNQLQVISSRYKYLVLDEVFHSSFSGDHKLFSQISKPNLIKINSLSKVVGLSMLRFGWIAASPNIIDEIRKISLLTFTDYPTPSLRIALAIMQNLPAIVNEIKSSYESNRQLVKVFIKSAPDFRFSHGLECGHFVAVNTKEDLGNYCLSSVYFGGGDMWRFRIDVSPQALTDFLDFMGAKK